MIDSSTCIVKPWGHELVLRNTGTYVVKVLHINAGCRLSLQYHRFKHETLILGSGSVFVEVRTDGVVTMDPLLSPIVLPPLTIHRVVAIEESDVVEVSSCELDDVVRLADDYGRTESESSPEETVNARPSSARGIRPTNGPLDALL